MAMAKNQQQLIEDFINGATEGKTGSSTNPGTLKIKGNQLIHFDTPILERYENKYIFNITRYSILTGLVQKKIKAMITEENRIEIKQIPANIQCSLSKYLK